MSKHDVDVTSTVEITINDEGAFDRLDDPSWRRAFDVSSKDDMLEHLAYNAVANGVERARDLDGFADLEPNAITMTVRTTDQLVTR